MAALTISFKPSSIVFDFFAILFCFIAFCFYPVCYSRHSLIFSPAPLLSCVDLFLATAPPMST
jgi:hypothetical protein